MKGERLSIPSGTKLNMLTVIKQCESRGGKTRFLCKCECGNEVVVYGTRLNTGKTRSCGCLQKKHKYENFDIYKERDHKLYRVWNDMKRRCSDERRSDFGRYGAKGITVCDEWQDFQNFFDWALANGYEIGLTIDRIDSSKGYSPSNCRWADIYVQSNNRSNNHLVTLDGETKTIAQWCKELNLSYTMVRSRLRRGWSDKDALTVPKRGDAV